MYTHSSLHVLGIFATLVISASAVRAQDTTIVPCDGNTVIGTYCYTNNDQHAWYWQSACGYPVTVHFLSGTIESSNYDRIIIYDGPDGLAPVIFQNPMFPGELDLTDLVIIGTSGHLYMEMTSNATNCCATDGLVSSGSGWAWNWTVTSGGTAGIDEAPAASFGMYPNPATDEVHLRLPDRVSGTVRIVDVSGRVMYQESYTASAVGLNTIELNGLRNGFYNVVLTTAGGVRARSLQVMR